MTGAEPQETLGTPLCACPHSRSSGAGSWALLGTAVPPPFPSGGSAQPREARLCPCVPRAGCRDGAKGSFIPWPGLQEIPWPSVARRDPSPQVRILGVSPWNRLGRFVWGCRHHPDLPRDISAWSQEVPPWPQPRLLQGIALGSAILAAGTCPRTWRGHSSTPKSTPGFEIAATAWGEPQTLGVGTAPGMHQPHPGAGAGRGGQQLPLSPSSAGVPA